MRKSALFAFGLVAMALVVLGLVVLSSASQAYALRIHGDVYGFLKRQVVYVGAGIAVAAIAALFDYRHFRDHPALVVAMLVATVAALVLVLFSAPVNGSRRWLDLKAFNLQPSELAKLVTVIAVAAWLDRSGWRVGLFRNGLLWPAVIIVMMAVPVLKEPDFGSVMVIGVAGVLMMVLGGVRWMHLMVVFFGGVAVVGAHVLTNANRMARIAAWLGIKINVGAQVAEGAANRAAYQASQALIALKNGGIWGVGINQSMQKKYYLPEAHTDFIFAIGAEELGMVFSIVVVLLFAAYFALAVHIARNAADRFGRSIALGMAFIIFFQAMFNIGVVCSALPTKGMALPFFSYGGTNMISAALATGMILSVGIQSMRERKRAMLRKIVLR